MKTFILNTLLPDESWLTLTPESLDEMMKERSGNLGNDDDPDGVFDLGKVADSMKAFVKNVSSVEGAEFPRYKLFFSGTVSYHNYKIYIVVSDVNCICYNLIP